MIADQLKRESAELEKEEDKSLRPKNFSKSVKKAQTDCLNTIFGFTKITWLMHPDKIITDMITDKDGYEMFSKYLLITSSLYQTHFQFICLFHSIMNAKVSWNDSVYFISVLLFFNLAESFTLILLSPLYSYEIFIITFQRTD